MHGPKVGSQESAFPYEQGIPVPPPSEVPLYGIAYRGGCGLIEFGVRLGPGRDICRGPLLARRLPQQCPSRR